MKKRYPCPCCGNKTLDEPPPGTYLICSICGWEDDPVQFDDPAYAGGANEVSLKRARENFQLFGKADPKRKT
jgi:cysteine-rich CPCC protein